MSTFRYEDDPVMLGSTGDSEGEEEEEEFVYPGNEEDEPQAEQSLSYSAQLAEVLGGDTEEQDNEPEILDADELDEGFVYTGLDADPANESYDARLRDVLGSEHDSEEAHEVENSLLSIRVEESSEQEKEPHATVPENDNEDGHALAHHARSLSPSSPSATSEMPVTPPRALTPLHVTGSLPNTPSKSSPFLHPHVSRLRSQIPDSPSSPGSLQPIPSRTASPSHFSAISRTSSLSNLRQDSVSLALDTNDKKGDDEREVFKWSVLQNITHHLYTSLAHQKASAILGSESPGIPTVLAANGFICLGTQLGRVCVYDFKQTLRCICGTEADGKVLGPVTALALSHDHTFVAAGHQSGYIRLFNLKSPANPARVVPPTTLNVVASGRKEGHLQGSRIVSVGFISGRHTAIVSADEYGLAFYHTLGKVLFVEATDILRILGKYPLGDLPSRKSVPQGSITPAQRRPRHTVLGMAPLPLGTATHPTDAYNLVALLTPTKLIVVGLKPSPKTWLKCSHVDSVTGSSRFKGCLAWFPSIFVDGEQSVPSTKKPVSNGTTGPAFSDPVLAYSLGSTLFLIKVKETKISAQVKRASGSKGSEIEVGNIVYDSMGKVSLDGDIHALQWLNLNQILLVSNATLQVIDVKTLTCVEKVPFEPQSLISLPSVDKSISSAGTDELAGSIFSHSLRTYKGKIFLLDRSSVRVGILLTWADRILSYVSNGNFLGAIELARSYYLDIAPGNRNGLPNDKDTRKEAIGKKMRDLMVASANYAFSEDRMFDDTHITPDGRGVDRTDFFEGLVSTCCMACIALEDTTFLFEDLFQHYEDNGISSIFLHQLETFVLNSQIHEVPPRITQKLIQMHHENDRSDLIERLIWHIDPLCLDIDQAIVLCEHNGLYDALIYVYTRALKDYVAPVVKLLGLLRTIFQRRRVVDTVDVEIETLILTAYKIFPYLSQILSGLEYPSGAHLDPEEAVMAKKAIYTFLFFGRASFWPSGGGGKLILTSEDGGTEPTYPYARQLLRFDAESFLHSLDIAFEDGYLNDQTQSVSRSLIIRILLDIVSSDNLAISDVTFVYIFVARNVPKYPQFLQDIPPSTLHNVLIGLATDPSPDTREDRQLAAEFLLSVYNPHESQKIIALFQSACFYRILRTWYRQDHRWAPLLSTYVIDAGLDTPNRFDNLNEVLTLARRAHKGKVPQELVAIVRDALPDLLPLSVEDTASLIDTHLPELHEAAIGSFGESAEMQKFQYLQHLLGPRSSSEDDDHYLTLHRLGPSSHLASDLCSLYVSLHAKYDAPGLIASLEYLPLDFMPLEDVIRACEDNEAYDSVVWAINKHGDPRRALEKSDKFEKRLTMNIVNSLSSSSSTPDKAMACLTSLAHIGVSICLERSQQPDSDIPLEDIWFQLLSSQINCVQSVSTCCGADVLTATSRDALADLSESSAWATLSSLRSLVRQTFSSLVSVTSTRIISFPRLFKRLVDSVPHSASQTQYAEFRIILTGMLESYRWDGDMLIISKHLVDRDLFENLAEVAAERGRGWKPSIGVCAGCRKPLLKPKLKDNGESLVDDEVAAPEPIVVSRKGFAHHQRCSLVDTLA